MDSQLFRRGIMSNALPLEQRIDAPAPAPFSVGRVSLFHFRNYDDLQLNFGTTPVVLTGANGSGKTNLLEAISLLVPGRGLRRAGLAEMQNQSLSPSWAVAIDINTSFGPMTIGTGRDTQDDEVERRIVHI